MTPSSTVTVTVLGLQLCARVPGGTGRYTAHLLDALAANAPAWAQPQVFAHRRCTGGLPSGWPVLDTAMPMPVLGRLWERGAGPTPAARGVVHAPTLLTPPARGRYRLIVTVHDVVPWSHPQTLTRRGVAFHRRMGRRVAQQADLIVTPTEAVATQVRALLSPRCPVVAVHSGVTVGPVPVDAADRRLRYAVDPGYVLFVGTAEPRKGLDVLVQALALPALSGRRLVVVGPPGWGDVRVEDLARRAGVSQRVVVTGAVDEAALATWYAGAAALALPSRAEGFGFPVLEAMAHGIPVVISDDPALVEVAGGAARVAPIDDQGALTEALADAAALGPQRDEWIRAGRSRAAEFTWAGTAARMWAIYRSVARDEPLESTGARDVAQ